MCISILWNYDYISNHKQITIPFCGFLYWLDQIVVLFGIILKAWGLSCVIGEFTHMRQFLLPYSRRRWITMVTIHCCIVTQRRRKRRLRILRQSLFNCSYKQTFYILVFQFRDVLLVFFLPLSLQAKIALILCPFSGKRSNRCHE